MQLFAEEHFPQYSDADTFKELRIYKEAKPIVDALDDPNSSSQQLSDVMKKARALYKMANTVWPMVLGNFHVAVKGLAHESWNELLSAKETSISAEEYLAYTSAHGTEESTASLEMRAHVRTVQVQKDAELGTQSADLDMGKLKAHYPGAVKPTMASLRLLASAVGLHTFQALRKADEEWSATAANGTTRARGTGASASSGGPKRNAGPDPDPDVETDEWGSPPSSATAKHAKSIAARKKGTLAAGLLAEGMVSAQTVTAAAASRDQEAALGQMRLQYEHKIELEKIEVARVAREAAAQRKEDREYEDRKLKDERAYREAAATEANARRAHEAKMERVRDAEREYKSTIKALKRGLQLEIIKLPQKVFDEALYLYEGKPGAAKNKWVAQRIAAKQEVLERQHETDIEDAKDERTTELERANAV